MIKEEVTTQELLENVLEGIFQLKGKEVVSLDMSKLQNAVCDYFVICEGDSNVHVDSIAGAVEKQVKVSLKEFPWHKSGYANAQWILLDYGSVVVHVFQKEYRDFYQLEELWADATMTKFKETFES